MENLTVKKESLHKAWTDSDASGRKVLETLFGAGNMPQPITYRVTSFQEACDILGTSPETELPYPSPSSSRQRGINAFAKAAVIAEALNEGWKPDWTDPNQYKYYPYFTNTGSGFSYTAYGHWLSAASVGSRLCFKSRELAEYAGKQFKDIYNEYFTI